MPPFGFITEEQINAYRAGEPAAGSQAGALDSIMDKLGLGGVKESRSHEQEFEDSLNARIELMKARSPEMKDREISEEEKAQAKEQFAKVRVYRNEFEQKAASGELPKEFVEKTYLQVKLQQAQFLGGLYSESIASAAR